MEIKYLHEFNISQDEARKIQLELSRVVENTSPVFKNISEIKSIAGCYVCYSRDDRRGYCSAVIMKFPSLEIIEKVDVKGDISFPYIPGLLFFRDGTLLIEVFKKIRVKPDVVIFYGHGISHPLKIGLASHAGVWFDVVSIGCAEKLLCGSYEEPPPAIKGAYNFIKGPYEEITGICLRTKPYVKPLFISCGYKIDIEIAGDLIMAVTKNHRFPEPLRIARISAKKLRSFYEDKG